MTLVTHCSAHGLARTNSDVHLSSSRVPEGDIVSHVDGQSNDGLRRYVVREQTEVTIRRNE
jgi:hypothetical protein